MILLLCLAAQPPKQWSGMCDRWWTAAWRWQYVIRSAVGCGWEHLPPASHCRHGLVRMHRIGENLSLQTPPWCPWLWGLQPLHPETTIQECLAWPPPTASPSYPIWESGPWIHCSFTLSVNTRTHGLPDPFQHSSCFCQALSIMPIVSNRVTAMATAGSSLPRSVTAQLWALTALKLPCKASCREKQGTCVDLKWRLIHAGTDGPVAWTLVFSSDQWRVEDQSKHRCPGCWHMWLSILPRSRRICVGSRGISLAQCDTGGRDTSAEKGS